jgi:ParB-like chromosome segregation protein Spo0J
MPSDDKATAGPLAVRGFERPVLVKNGLQFVGSTQTPVLVDIEMLKLWDSPRLDGEDPAHVRLLVEVEDELPPILVHRQTMCVIDGRHRLRAAALRGDATIAVRFFDGDENEAFILGVTANITHGLPLSLADRRAAAARIIEVHGEWSDRAIAAMSGLSADTVGVIRKRSTGGSRQLGTRVGRDGKMRPVDPSQGRLRAGEMFAASPQASLREVARAAGIAVGTARDVRERMRQGLAPTRDGGKNASSGGDAVRLEQRSVDQGSGGPVSGADWERVLAVLGSLRKDPSLRFNEAGRRVLRVLDQHALTEQDRVLLMSGVPSHCAIVVARLARVYSTLWDDLAKEIDEQVKRLAI